MDLFQLFSAVKQKTSFPFRKRIGSWSKEESCAFRSELYELELWLSEQLELAVKEANPCSLFSFDAFDKRNPLKDIRGTLSAVRHLRDFLAEESEWIRVYHFAKRGYKFYPKNKKQETV